MGVRCEWLLLAVGFDRRVEEMREKKRGGGEERGGVSEWLLGLERKI